MTPEQYAAMMFAIYSVTFLPKWMVAISGLLWGTLWIVRLLT